jgi:hypothetical protein
MLDDDDDHIMARVRFIVKKGWGLTARHESEARHIWNTANRAANQQRNTVPCNPLEGDNHSWPLYQIISARTKQHHKYRLQK